MQTIALCPELWTIVQIKLTVIEPLLSKLHAMYGSHGFYGVGLWTQVVLDCIWQMGCKAIIACPKMRNNPLIFGICDGVRHVYILCCREALLF